MFYESNTCQIRIHIYVCFNMKCWFKCCSVKFLNLLHFSSKSDARCLSLDLSTPENWVLYQHSRSIFLAQIYGKVPSSNAEAKGRKVWKELIIICHLSCIRHCVKCYTYTISFNNHNTHAQLLLLIPVLPMKKSIGRWATLYQITWLEQAEARGWN